MATKANVLDTAIAFLLNAPALDLSVSPNTPAIFRSINDSHSNELPTWSFRPVYVRSTSAAIPGTATRRPRPAKLNCWFSGMADDESIGLDASNLIAYSAESFAAAVTAHQALQAYIKDAPNAKARTFGAMHWLATMGAYAAQEARQLATVVTTVAMF